VVCPAVCVPACVASRRSLISLHTALCCAAYLSPLTRPPPPAIAPRSFRLAVPSLESSPPGSGRRQLTSSRAGGARQRSSRRRRRSGAPQGGAAPSSSPVRWGRVDTLSQQHKVLSEQLLVVRLVDDLRRRQLGGYQLPSRDGSTGALRWHSSSSPSFLQSSMSLSPEPIVNSSDRSGKRSVPLSRRGRGSADGGGKGGWSSLGSSHDDDASRFLAAGQPQRRQRHHGQWGDTTEREEREEREQGRRMVAAVPPAGAAAAMSLQVVGQANSGTR
jgi:hypothetical protein